MTIIKADAFASAFILLKTLHVGDGLCAVGTRINFLQKKRQKTLTNPRGYGNIIKLSARAGTKERLCERVCEPRG